MGSNVYTVGIPFSQPIANAQMPDAWCQIPDSGSEWFPGRWCGSGIRYPESGIHTWDELLHMHSMRGKR